MIPGDLARVADIRARADAARGEDLDPGPLADDLDHLDALRAVAVAHAADPDDGGSIMDYWAELHRFDTALLRAARVAIATATAARADVPWLLDRLAAETERADEVRALHRTHVEKRGAKVCVVCLEVVPCPTISALGEEPG